MAIHGRVSLLFFIGIIMILHATHDVSAIECYGCTGVGCGDDFDPKAFGVTTMECDGSCMKTKTKTVVIRSCLPGPPHDECKGVESNEGELMDTCVCGGKLCNAATGVTVSMATNISTLAALVLWKILFVDRN